MTVSSDECRVCHGSGSLVEDEDDEENTTVICQHCMGHGSIPVFQTPEERRLWTRVGVLERDIVTLGKRVSTLEARV